MYLRTNERSERRSIEAKLNVIHHELDRTQEFTDNPLQPTVLQDLIDSVSLLLQAVNFRQQISGCSFQNFHFEEGRRGTSLLSKKLDCFCASPNPRQMIQQ